MTAKEYLEQVRRNDSIIKNLTRDLQAVEEMIDSFGSIVNLEEKKETLSKKITDLVNCRLTISEEINQIGDECSRDIMYRRYILLQPWETIGVETGYNIRHVQRLNAGALIEFYEKFKGVHGFTHVGANDKYAYRKKGYKS